MHIEKISRGSARLEITSDELAILSSALNEVCHGLEQWEFSTRMGAEKSEVLKLLHWISEALHRTEE